MKVSVIANVSVNGRFLLSDNPHHKLPPEVMEFYLEFAKRVGNLVIGFKTFENFQHFPTELREKFKEIEIVILSDQAYSVEGYKVVGSPEEAIAYMTAKGITEMAVGGGIGTFNAFIDKDLVTDFYLNMSPVLIGGSGTLGNNNDFFSTLQFKEYSYKEGFLQLHLIKE